MICVHSHHNDINTYHSIYCVCNAIIGVGHPMWMFS